MKNITKIAVAVAAVLSVFAATARADTIVPDPFCTTNTDWRGTVGQMGLHICQLQNAVADLQAENADLRSQSANLSNVIAPDDTLPQQGYSDPRISDLESRMAKVESAVNFIQTTVLSALQNILKFIAK